MREASKSVAFATIAWISVVVCGLSELALAEVQTYKFNRGLPAGASSTSLWQGVVVEVNGQLVKPRFVTHRRVFFSWWNDFPATAIRACKVDAEGFSSSDNCITVQGNMIEIPEGSSPFSYSYKFQYNMENEGKREDEFMLEKIGEKKSVN